MRSGSTAHRAHETCECTAIRQSGGQRTYEGLVQQRQHILGRLILAHVAQHIEKDSGVAGTLLRMTATSTTSLGFICNNHRHELIVCDNASTTRAVQRAVRSVRGFAPHWHSRETCHQ